MGFQVLTKLESSFPRNSHNSKLFKSELTCIVGNFWEFLGIPRKLGVQFARADSHAVSMNWNIWRFYHYRIPLEFNYFPTTPFQHEWMKQPYVVYVFQIVLKLSSVHIYFICFFFRNYYMSITFWLLILWFLEGRKSKQGKYMFFFPIFSLFKYDTYM